MSISEEAKQKIIENNREISELLTENEKILREQGFDPPEENYAADEDDKIKLPWGYIRTKDSLIRKFHLEEIASNWTIRSNIGYALQLSDFHNYIFNRIYLWGPVKTMFYKSAVINLISIFEAIVLECANQICYNPSKCRLRKKCDKPFNKEQRNNVFSALQRLNELNVTSFSDDEMIRIKELIELRNRVHIRLANEKEYLSDEFDLSLYNEAIKLLQSVSEQIYTKGKPLYFHCSRAQEIAEIEEMF